MFPASGISDAGPRSDSTNTARRRFVNILLGTGLTASAASFVYPILRYLTHCGNGAQHREDLPLR